MRGDYMKYKYIGKYERVITELRKDFVPNHIYDLSTDELAVIARLNLINEFEEIKDTKKKE
ncbi:MAG: hypothetical protein QW255_04565 [Candidatus Bilamarchaeaceae archaeon]